MRISTRLMTGAAVLFGAALALQCTSQQTPPAESSVPAAAGPADMQPVVSVRELMTYVVDPLADNVFDAVGVDVTEKGTVETAPRNDEDWERIRQGAVVLAEASNLLKIPRPVAPAGDNVAKNPMELHPEEIQANIDNNRPAWNAYANGLREEALKVFDIVEQRDASALFQAGSDIDRACENCHIAFWYPAERALVEKNRNSGVFKETPAQ
jgi:hypothetical protein